MCILSNNAAGGHPVPVLDLTVVFCLLSYQVSIMLNICSHDTPAAAVKGDAHCWILPKNRRWGELSFRRISIRLGIWLGLGDRDRVRIKIRRNEIRRV